MLVLFFKAEQLSLFPTPTYVAGHVRKDGVAVAPHVAMRKRKITGSTAERAPARVKAPKLDRFIADRYAGWRTPEGQAMLGGKRSLEEIAERVATQGVDPQPKSGRQEYLENLYNRHI